MMRAREVADRLDGQIAVNDLQAGMQPLLGRDDLRRELPAHGAWAEDARIVSELFDRRAPASHIL